MCLFYLFLIIQLVVSAYDYGRFSLALGVWHNQWTKPSPDQVLLSCKDLRKNKCGK